MIVSATRYGRTKAKRHAQSEANRLGRRVHLQLEPVYGTDGKLEVHVRTDRPYLMGAPFHTFYPETDGATVPDGADGATGRPRTLAKVDRDGDCETGHVFGLISGNVRHCVRIGCSHRDAYDPDDFVTADGDLYDWDDPDRDELGYCGEDAYVLRNN